MVKLRIRRSHLSLLIRSQFHISQPFLERMNLIKERDGLYLVSLLVTTLALYNKLPP